MIEFYNDDDNFRWFAIDNCNHSYENVDNNAYAVLVHGDLTHDHIYVCLSQNGKKLSNLTNIIDFGDSSIAPVEYEWIPLYLDALKCSNQFWELYYDSRLKTGFQSDGDHDDNHDSNRKVCKIVLKSQCVDKVCIQRKSSLPN